MRRRHVAQERVRGPDDRVGARGAREDDGQVVVRLQVVAADVLRLGGSVKGDLGLPLLGFLVVTGFGVVVVCRVGAWGQFNSIKKGQTKGPKVN